MTPDYEEFRDRVRSLLPAGETRTVDELMAASGLGLDLLIEVLKLMRNSGEISDSMRWDRDKFTACVMSVDQ